MSLLGSWLVLLAGCPRIFALIAMAPGFSAGFVAPQIRVAIAFALSLALAPLATEGISPARLMALTPAAYLGLLLSELCLGGLMGLLAAWLLEAARLAGEIVDLQIGFRVGALYDPAEGSPTSVLGRFWFLAALVIFFALNGHHALLRGLARSYELCPLGAIVFHRNLLAIALPAITALFLLAIQTAAPLIAALIIADIVLGLIGRGMPQMNLLWVGLPGKILVGLGALALSSPVIVALLAQSLDMLQVQLRALFKAVGA